MSFGVSSLSLSNFRNYRDLSVDLQPGFTILAGPNAQGKTNFLEAIYLLSTTRMLRGQKDSEAILQGEHQARAAAVLESGTDVSVVLEAGVRKKILLNGSPLPRAADILGRLPCVTITIFDLELVRGEPNDRRTFLDLELSALYSSYLRHLSHYKRALEQRNALLKIAQERPVDPDLFTPWEQHLAEHGSAMRRMRESHIERINAPAKQNHLNMSSSTEDLNLVYVSKDDLDSAEKLFDKYQSGRLTEIHRGSTTIGPHRDDVSILIDGKEVKLFGSQGQQRTAVISIKLASLSVGSEILGDPPILLLDDMLSDLDPVRRSKLCELVLDQASQAILTCTEAEAAGAEILSRAQVYNVRAGTVTHQ